MIVKGKLPLDVDEKLRNGACQIGEAIDIDSGFMAGGVMLSIFQDEHPRDVDIFRWGEENKRRLSCVHMYKVDRIESPKFTSPKAILESFDLVHSACGIDLETKRIWHHKDWLELVQREEIRLLAPGYNLVGTVQRVVMKMNQGWDLSQEEAKELLKKAGPEVLEKDDHYPVWLKSLAAQLEWENGQA